MSPQQVHCLFDDLSNLEYLNKVWEDISREHRDYFDRVRNMVEGLQPGDYFIIANMANVDTMNRFYTCLAILIGLSGRQDCEFNNDYSKFRRQP